jgi:hypothetical protein
MYFLQYMKIIHITIIVLLLIPLAHSELAISQIFYDAEGSDTGKEFIELYTNASVNLQEYQIYTSSGTEWSLLWDGTSCILCSIEGHISFGNTSATYEVDLTLQNTKGAVQIRNHDQIVDTVGYGNIPSNYSQGTPAKDIDADKSLVRIHTTNNNSFDFQADTPEIRSDPILRITITNEPPKILSYEGQTLFVEDENGLEDIWGISIDGNLYEIQCEEYCNSPVPLIGIVFIIDSNNQSSNTITILPSKFTVEAINQTISKPGKTAQLHISIKKEGYSNIPIVVYVEEFVSKLNSFPLNISQEFTITNSTQTITLNIDVPRGTIAGTYMGKIRILQVNAS